MTELLSRAERIRARIRGVPTGTWVKCPGCRAGAHRDRIAGHHNTCPECGHHYPLTAAERVDLLVDPGSFVECDADLRPLGFTDTVPNPTRRTGSQDGARWGVAAVAGHPVVLCVLDVGFLGGSIGAVVGEKVSRAAEHARLTRVPLLVCSASDGARLPEGVSALLQMAKAAAALRRLADAGVPYVSVICDPVHGGASASFASLGDIIIAEQGARAGGTGPAAVEQEPPPGFQTAESLLENGHIDAVLQRPDLRPSLARILGWHAAAVASDALDPVPGDGCPGPDACGAHTVWDVVRLARESERPHVGEYVADVFEDFVELRGDRATGDDPSIVGGLAVLGGVAVVVAGHRRGRAADEESARDFGMPHPAGYRKAARLMRLAERVGTPFLTFVDTPDACRGVHAEPENQSGAIADNLALLAGLGTPVVSVVVGEGGGGGALALGVADRLLMLENTVYSVISPDGHAALSSKDAERAEVADALRLTAAQLHEAGVADRIVPEPPGGAHTDRPATTAAVRAALLEELASLRQVPVDELLDRRYHRLRTAVTFADADRR